MLFGGFALLLSCVGLHGVTSYSVARRTNAIGVRLALGAQRSQVPWLVLRQVLLVALLGLSIGLPTALLCGRFVASLLYGITPTDPTPVAVAAAALLGVAIAAGWLPARRAARMEAVSALRQD